ncbi:hypothetical protein BC833DRAFT_360966 [Globomyces pollinis-pini]|nr:hypothetical protein BC833DRAFT_360966 [Globomyces pollinis-pini]
MKLMNFIFHNITTDDFVALLTDLFFPNGTPIDKSRYLNPEKDARLLENAVLVLKGCLAPNVDRDLKLFGDHCRRYINMYHVRAGYEIDRTFRYKSTDKVEARVRSTRVWENGDEIKFMCGFIVELTPEEEKMLDNRDFSVMYSSKRDANCLFTGPARFVNHDCRANCQFIPAGNGSDEIFFKVKRRIEIGEELTTYYGDNYFGENNCECLCASCELYTTGAFAPKLGTTGVISETLQVRNRPTRGIKSTFSYRDLTKKDLIGLDAKLELEKRKRKAPEGNCEICQTVLDITARPTVFLDTSIMQATHCSRCYRHELIFDIEWPDRKFVHKSSKVRPRVKKQKSTNVVEDEDQEHIQDIKPPSVPSCFVLSKGDSEESLISIVDEIAPEINNEPAPVMENIENPGKVVNEDKDGHQELNMLIDSPNKIITENQSIPLDSSMPSQDQNASLHQEESIDVVMEDINESKRKSRQSEPNYADSSSDVSADSFTIGNDDDNSMSIGIVKGVVPKMSYVVPRVVWVDPQEDAPFWWPALVSYC